MFYQIKRTRKIHIDFSQKIHQLSFISSVLLIAGLMFSTYAIWQHYEVKKTMLALEHELSLIPVIKPKQNPVANPEIEKISNQIMVQLTVKWPELFDLIEHHYNPNITITSVLLDAKTHVIRIAGSSKSINSIIEYVENLKTEHIFERVDLLNHHLSTLNGNAIHSFEIYAKWQ